MSVLELECVGALSKSLNKCAKQAKSELSWRPALLGWRALLLGWRPPLLGSLKSFLLVPSSVRAPSSKARSP